MRASSPLALAMLVALGLGCRRAPAAPEASTPPTSAGPHVRTAPIEPGAPLDTARIDEAKVRLDLAQTRAAIRVHQQTHDGASPPSIDGLGLALSFPSDLLYDAATGTVRSQTYPAF
jgi:hypothetical protein